MFSRSDFHFEDDNGFCADGEVWTPKDPGIANKVKAPIVFIHTDHHDRTIWYDKPDQNPGWAEVFVSMGFTVYLIDLPHRATPDATPDMEAFADVYGNIQELPLKVVKDFFTACRQVNNPEWPEAKLHTQWPDNGDAEDKSPHIDVYTKRYIAKLRPECVDHAERQAASQQSIQLLLRHIGKPTTLLGHGSGAIYAMLAADLVPELVKCIIAVEPIGPPFGTCQYLSKDGETIEIGSMTRVKIRRPYGISDIPLTFDPPAICPQSFISLLDYDSCEEDLTSPLEVEKTWNQEESNWFFWQARSPGKPIRKLINLAKVPLVVLTGEASYHRRIDWATVAFLRQAGVKTDHIKLEKVGFKGNGHLCFLEKNSLEIARFIADGIPDVVLPAPAPSYPIPPIQHPGTGDIFQPSRQLQAIRTSSTGRINNENQDPRGLSRDQLTTNGSSSNHQGFERPVKAKGVNSRPEGLEEPVKTKSVDFNPSGLEGPVETKSVFDF